MQPWKRPRPWLWEWRYCSNEGAGISRRGGGRQPSTGFQRGQWIPRQKLEEAQVLVGNRVWLPFLRAQSYMTSRQALLDYSLTQLYRAAERHCS
ncbi:hypothetical protein F0U61_22285 [Archangium violaceum]|nr:hypothetical protein F0U61_22285 [Archangium violaceum]